MENKVKPISIGDRIKNAIEALRGKPHHSMTIGLEVKRCSECEQQLVETILERLYLRSVKSDQQYKTFTPGLDLAIDIVNEEAERCLKKSKII